MQCTNPVQLLFTGKTRKQQQQAVQYPDGLKVPCGKCLSCKINKVREWSLRMTHEQQYHQQSVFITLTYKEDSLPENASIKKRDLQLFLKRLRKEIEPRKIKYFACGEYGDTTDRPHYHIIMFGLGLDRKDKDSIMKCWNKTDWNVQSIRKAAFGLVEPESIQYVAKYIHKQYNGKLEEELYTKTGRETPFRLISQGIGKNYALENKQQIEENGVLTIRGVKHSIPRYYIKKLDLKTDSIKQKAIETEYKVLEKHTGISDLTYNVAYKVLKPSQIEETDKAIELARKQRDDTQNAKMQLKKRKL